MNYIYILKDPRNNEVRYVGKTNNPESRIKSHCYGGVTGTYCSNWINNLKSEGMTPEMEIIESNLSEDEWPEREKYWISYYRENGTRLTNIADGGRGIESKIYGKSSFLIVNKEKCIEIAKMGLKATEHNILLYFQGIMDYKNNVPKVSQVFLARELGATEMTISTCLKSLVEKGILKKDEKLGFTHYIVSSDVSTRGGKK